ncbi:MAG TPA: nucleotidyltransferase family protein [Patescibacteria group bacterium]|nr:nucleotidyltransferase family protein [Patescibacteria group bacterium]
MQAVILSAGKGTRLPEISRVMTKVMVPIGGKPLLQWHIEHLRQFDIIDIFVNLHYMPEQITEYFGDGSAFGVSIRYSFEKELLGTGGALNRIAKYITEDTVIIYGDVIAFVDFSKLLAFHKEHNALITAAMHHAYHPEDSDLVEYDTNFQIKKILAKPHLNHKIPENPHNLAALYMFSPEVFSNLISKSSYDIARDLLPALLERNGRIFGYDTSELITDIGTPERLEHMRNLLKTIKK